MSEKGLTRAFIEVMPKSVEELLRASSQVNDMNISEVVARAILKTGPITVEQAADARLSQCQTKETDSLITCYKCDGPNYLARDCLLRHKPIQKVGGTPKIPALGYKCKKQGHSLGVSGETSKGTRLQRQFFPQTPSKQGDKYGWRAY